MKAAWKKILRFLIGLLLLPVFAGMAKALFGQMSGWRFGGWSPEWYFLLGAGIGAAVYLVWPSQPGRLYVLGHELTHAIWAKIFGAKVSKISVSEKEGYVKLSKANMFITLAPYFFPFYAIAAVLVYFIARIFTAAPWVEPACIGLIGLCMVWHWVATYQTVSMGQPDFRQAGVFFSTVFTAILNIVVLAGLLKVISPKSISMKAFFSDSAIFSWRAYSTAATTAAGWVQRARSGI